MATYQIINLQTGEFRTVSLEEAAEIASLDPHEIEWAIEQEGVCETELHQITKLPEPPEGGGEAEDRAGQNDSDASDISDGENQTVDDHKQPLPVFVYISQAEFEAHLAESPAAVIRLGWDEPIVREAVEADKGRVMAELESGESNAGDVEPSGIYHLTRESIALIR
jgi:hypothetical protein